MTELVDEINALKRERRAVILAHNYTRAEVQEIADFTGDSLELARRATDVDAEVIVFCGVYFMAETAAILNPGKTVLIPDASAGCAMADMITGAQLRALKAAHPGALAVCYVNSTAEVKAECDICVTSGNAERVMASLPAGREILFVPDQHLGGHIAVTRCYCLIYITMFLYRLNGTTLVFNRCLAVFLYLLMKGYQYIVKGGAAAHFID
jgi:quinolinate synthase